MLNGGSIIKGYMHKLYMLFEEYLINGNLWRVTKNMTEHYKIEFIWTLVPAIVLIFLAIPSINYLYKFDMFVNFDHCTDGVTVKVIGAQWLWFYEFNNISTDWFMHNELYYDLVDLIPRNNKESVTTTSTLWNLPIEKESILFNINNFNSNSGQLRLLETTQPLYLPVHTPIRFLITSKDVLHCFAIPSLGIKMDACPGRLNQVFTIVNREGIFYGQCSELCGVNHAFMPIQLVGVWGFPHAVEFPKPFTKSPLDLLNELLRMLENAVNGDKPTNSSDVLEEPSRMSQNAVDEDELAKAKLLEAKNAYYEFLRLQFIHMCKRIEADKTLTFEDLELEQIVLWVEFGHLFFGDV